MHDGEEYGTLRWPLKDIATAVGCRLSELRALLAKGVLKGADVGEIVEAYVYVPRSGGRDGEPVILIERQPGPLWYSSRMVRDEHVRRKRAAGGELGGNPALTPKDNLGSDPGG